MPLRFIILCFFLFASQLVAEIQFNRDIRPILSDKCWQCHGPDSATREAGLRLDTEVAAKGLHEGHYPIKPGSTEESLLIERILTEDKDDVMPPPESNKSLTSEQKKLLADWIKQGAEWETHWSFQRIEKPQPPKSVSSDWSQNEVDLFIQRKLSNNPLSPSQKASRETLIRRLSLDLTGLPPRPEEREAFLSDKSPKAYESLVDRLLASPRYGERMAWQWLEAARYADTDGYQNDGPRTMWRWRDWVIAAYNQNKGFDKFTVEQLAGDLLPNPTLDDQIATGFNRNHRYNSESGLVIEEFLLENAVDRVDTTSTVWMGLTMGCARCHSHKFDPFTHKEYYQLLSFFNNVSESGRAIKFGNSEPWIHAPTPAQQRELRQLAETLEKQRNDLETAQDNALKELPKLELDASLFMNPHLTNGLTHHFSFNKKDPRVKVEKGGPVFREGRFGKSATVGGGGQFNLGKLTAFPTEHRFSVSFWLKPERLKEGAILSMESAGTGRKGLVVQLREGHLQFQIITRWIAGVSTLETLQPLKNEKWVHVTLINDGTQRARGMGIYLNGHPVKTKTLHNTNSNTSGKKAGDPLRIGGSPHLPHFKGQLDELRLYNRTLEIGEIKQLAISRSIAELATLPSAQLTPVEKSALGTWMLEHKVNDEPVALQKFHAILKRHTDFIDQLPTTMVMDERPKVRDTFVRERGVYDNHGEKVQSGVPSAFPDIAKTNPSRLDFARWLVSRDHPLTARVTINRYWQLLFGKGLVLTPGDFGSQGDLPTHPELLDWLASDFIESGWDIKAILKTMVMSATYQQSSNITKKHLQNDPENLLYARAPRQKLPGNVLRDQALFASGLLVEQQGGPSVKPYQPAKLWAEASNFKYKQDKGDGLYRRSIYTYWKRTLAPPSMAVLDTGDREVCTVKPKKTNTPLQALTLLNETAFFEAARKLAERSMQTGGDTPEHWIKDAFVRTMSRQPKVKELNVLTSAYQSYLAEIKAQGKSANALLKIGESKADSSLPLEPLLAMTAIGNVLLNLDETTTRE
ncbi:DUF1553 domain-containing protein [Verrucomicrobia bacterium]|nr:DUF1553 domain-containing protein [Verrucomicrobiota bacterium]MDB4459156.1 DUF1553 domain-containing protein [bacterium]